MKRIFIAFIIAASILSPLYSWDEKMATSEIQLAQKKMSDLEYNFELKKFIPHDNYAEAVISLRKARLAMEQKDFIHAYYHSSMAIVKTETTTIAALVRKTNEEKTKLEIEFLKKKQAKPKPKPRPMATEILDARLLKKGEHFRIIFPDRHIFEGRKFTLSSYGEDSLMKIVRVLEKFDNATVKIAGHSRNRDLRNYTRRKADFIKKFFIESGIDEERISTVGVGNHEVMDTAIGFVRVDRVEVIISGIKLKE